LGHLAKLILTKCIDLVELFSQPANSRERHDKVPEGSLMNYQEFWWQHRVIFPVFWQEKRYGMAVEALLGKSKKFKIANGVIQITNNQ